MVPQTSNSLTVKLLLFFAFVSFNYARPITALFCLNLSFVILLWIFLSFLCCFYSFFPAYEAFVKPVELSLCVKCAPQTYLQPHASETSALQPASYQC